MPPRSGTAKTGRGFILYLCRYVRDELGLIFLTILFCVLLAVGYELFREKVFPVRATVQFRSGYWDELARKPAFQAADFKIELAEAIRSKDVLSSVVRQTDVRRFAILGTDDPMQELQDSLRIRIGGSSDRLEIGLDTPFPHQGAMVVNAVIRSLLSPAPGSNTGSLLDPRRVTSVDEATANVRAEGLSPAFVIAISADFGLILGLMMILHQGASGQRVRSAEQTEETIGLRAIGSLPLLASQLSVAGRGQASYIDPTSKAAVQCRSSLVHLFGDNLREGSGSLLVTSPYRGDGSSTVALNLSLILAMEGAGVVLIDADSHFPVLHKLLEMPNFVPGFAEGLESPSRVDSFVQPTHVSNLYLLSCGSAPSVLDTVWQKGAIDAVLVNLRKKYRYLILNSGPVLGNVFTLALVPCCETSLLVLQAKRTRLSVADECRKTLVQYGASQVAALINARHKVVRRNRTEDPTEQPEHRYPRRKLYKDIYDYGWFRQEQSRKSEKSGP